MFEPGGDSIVTFSSAWSSSGKKPKPTSALPPTLMDGMASAKKNVPAAIAVTVQRWSSAQAITCL
jgi:hypothetical protein